MLPPTPLRAPCGRRGLGARSALDLALLPRPSRSREAEVRSGPRGGVTSRARWRRGPGRAGRHPPSARPRRGATPPSPGERRGVGESRTRKTWPSSSPGFPRTPERAGPGDPADARTSSTKTTGCLEGSPARSSDLELWHRTRVASGSKKRGASALNMVYLKNTNFHPHS